MKRYGIFFVLLLCVSSLFASESAGANKSLSEEDIAYLKNNGVYSNVNLAGSFTQIKEVGVNSRQFKSSGNVIISPENGIAWFTEKPYKSVLVIAKDHLTQKIRNNEPVRMEVSQNPVYTQIANSIECVFFGDFETMLKVFDTDFSLENEAWFLELVPKDKMLSLFIKSIVITGKTGIESLKLYEISGDSILYSFENLMPKELTDEENSVWQM